MPFIKQRASTKGFIDQEGIKPSICFINCAWRFSASWTSWRMFWLGFLWVSQERKRRVLDAIIAAGSSSRRFFVRFRSLLVGAYFASDAGFKAIVYLGNIPLQSYPAVPPEVERIDDDELRPLGL